MYVSTCLSMYCVKARHLMLLPCNKVSVVILDSPSQCVHLTVHRHLISFIIRLRSSSTDCQRLFLCLVDTVSVNRQPDVLPGVHPLGQHNDFMYKHWQLVPTQFVLHRCWSVWPLSKTRLNPFY